MSDNPDYARACRDALAVLNGAVEIRYANTEVWRLDADDGEHPVVPLLRAAAMDAVVAGNLDSDMVGSVHDLNDMLRAERQANGKMRDYLNRVQSLCELAGLPAGANGDELLTWLRSRLG